MGKFLNAGHKIDASGYYGRKQSDDDDFTHFLVPAYLH